MNRDGDAGFYFLREPDDVPVCQPNTAMTGGATDRLRGVGTVEANAFLIERDPDHADGTVRTGRQHVEVTAALTVFEHLFVVAESWQLRYALHFPFT